MPRRRDRGATEGQLRRRPATAGGESGHGENRGATEGSLGEGRKPVRGKEGSGRGGERANKKRD